MSIGEAVFHLDTANRAMRYWGACEEVVAMYEQVADDLERVGQTYLAEIARNRAAVAAELV